MTDPRSVFVVHGRNLAMRDAMASFLKALDLNPLEWEDAGALTGQATPRTLESIRAGMNSAQAVIVLMTGDDQTRLRREYGHEVPAFQARPNVLFEAGMALSIIGEDRTILVQSGATRLVSDLAGLNYLTIDNSPEKRHALAERLKRAGCQLKTTSAVYLNTERAGDFEAAIEIDATGPFILRRGEFDEHIVDSSLSYTINNIKMLAELEDQLRNPGASDMKYSYLGVSGATNWLRLSESEQYAPLDTRRLLIKAIPKLFDNDNINANEIDFISLGTGDGMLDARIISSLARICTVKNYYPLDISVELLQQTIENTKAPCERLKIKIKAIVGDFEYLKNYKPIYGYDDAINVLALLGFTFGNYRESELIAQIRDGMNSGDFLLIDARLHDQGKNVDIKMLQREPELIKNYSHALNNQFAFGQVEMATTADLKNANLKQEINEDYTSVPSAFNIVTFCENLKTKIRRSGRSISHPRLDLAVTTMYDERELVEWLCRRGFREISSQLDRNSIALLLQKK